MDTCKVCGRKCKNKGFTTIGGQKACSIHCAINIIPFENDRCSQCGAPVWINDAYKINGQMCCSKMCKEEVEQKTANLRTKKKVAPQSDFLEPYQKSSEISAQNDYNDYSTSKKSQKSTKNTKYTTNYTTVNVGTTNYALGPREYNTTDYDVGPGDKSGNVYHGDANFKYSNSNNSNNYNYYNNDDDEEFDEEDEAYGDYNERNYLREYGQHNYVQKNDKKSGDEMKQLGMNASDKKDKPKNEIKEFTHQGNDINCEYCGFSIKAGSNAFVDNFGKVFDTSECFSNHFQGIPKPNFG